MLINPLLFLFRPQNAWKHMSGLSSSYYTALSLLAALLAILPAYAWYVGTTHTGWTVAGGDISKLTTESAFRIVCAFYVMMLFSLASIGYFIHWMAKTYGTESSIAKGIATATMASIPMFLAGLSGFYPLLWLDLILGTLAVCWSVYLLYTGIPIVMKIPEEQGFLYSSAIIAVCLVLLIIMLVCTVILWQWGFMPVFIDQ